MTKWGIVVALAACGGSPGKHELFPPEPECTGAPIVALRGMFPQVMATIAIGGPNDGFDLDGDGKPDNRLSHVSSLAQGSLDKALAADSILVPIELFDATGAMPDACVKLATYRGAYTHDDDGDGATSYVHGGDCNDHDPAIHPGAPEIVGNFKDDNCDGRADEDAHGMASTDAMDRDHDGYTIAQGDCDDTNPMVHPGMPEICGDGLDNDCDGMADRSEDASGHVTACSPFDAGKPVMMPIAPDSLDPTGAPLTTFTDGSISSALELAAGPSQFRLEIPFSGTTPLDLVITGAQLDGTLAMTATGMTISHGRLGGVIDVRTADNVRGLTVKEIGLTPDASLLDAVFANILGPLLELPDSPHAKQYPMCLTPDIDVDGDGLESFCDSRAGQPDDPKKVDVCIDGDGTVVHSTFDAAGALVTSCAQAIDAHGKPRFVDGISLVLDFTTVPLAGLVAPR
jgi:hypothetical protein